MGGLFWFSAFGNVLNERHAALSEDNTRYVYCITVFFILKLSPSSLIILKFRRCRHRQRNHKIRATLRAVFRMNLPVMHRDNRLADC